MKKINILLVGHGPRGKIWSKVMQKKHKSKFNWNL